MPPSVLHRVRWGNVARALLALGAVALVVAWPRLSAAPPVPPSGATVPVAPTPPPGAMAPTLRQEAGQGAPPERTRTAPGEGGARGKRERREAPRERGGPRRERRAASGQQARPRIARAQRRGRRAPRDAPTTREHAHGRAPARAAPVATAAPTPAHVPVAPRALPPPAPPRATPPPPAPAEFSFESG